MSTEENKRVVRHLFEELYNRANLSVIDDLVAENAPGHDATREEPVRGCFIPGCLPRSTSLVG